MIRGTRTALVKSSLPAGPPHVASVRSLAERTVMNAGARKSTCLAVLALCASFSYTEPARHRRERQSEHRHGGQEHRRQRRQGPGRQGRRGRQDPDGQRPHSGAGGAGGESPSGSGGSSAGGSSAGGSGSGGDSAGGSGAGGSGAGGSDDPDAGAGGAASGGSTGTGERPWPVWAARASPANCARTSTSRPPARSRRACTR